MFPFDSGNIEILARETKFTVSPRGQSLSARDPHSLLLNVNYTAIDKYGKRGRIFWCDFSFILFQFSLSEGALIKQLFIPFTYVGYEMVIATILDRIK